MSKRIYISLGPTCVPAEILKAADMRSSTLGFDWFRSGDYFISEFFNSDVEEFIVQHVIKPSIALRQCQNPNMLINQTAELEVLKPNFGFNYLYNPHRSYAENTNLEYLKMLPNYMMLFIIIA